MDGKTKQQEVKMLNRKSLDITGVNCVESFDNEEFQLETNSGFLIVRGQNLHMQNLDLEQGLVAIDGIVHSLNYCEGRQSGRSKRWFGKLLR